MAKKRKKGAVRRLKVVTTDGVNNYIRTFKYANTTKTDEELVNFFQGMNALSANELKSIVRTDVEDITKALPSNFEKAEGVAVYDATHKVITSKIKFATNADAQNVLDGAEARAREDGANIYDWTVAVFDDDDFKNSGYKFANTTDAQSMLNDTLAAYYTDNNNYTVGMITSDGQLVDSGYKFASLADINAFLAEKGIVE